MILRLYCGAVFRDTTAAPYPLRPPDRFCFWFTDPDVSLSAAETLVIHPMFYEPYTVYADPSRPVRPNMT